MSGQQKDTIKDPNIEAKIRKDLEEKLGVEFCTGKELQAEFEKACRETQHHTREHFVPEEMQVSATDVILECNDAISKMSQNNPHKLLIYKCACLIRCLVDDLDRARNPQKVM